MADTIDGRDLTDEQVEALEVLADFYRRWRERKKPKRTKGKKGVKHKEECALAIWDSDVIGTLSREELYEAAMPYVPRMQGMSASLSRST